MAHLVKHHIPGQLTMKARIETEALFNGIESSDFIVDSYDAKKGGIVRKSPHYAWDKDALPYADGYYVALEGDSGDVVEFKELADATVDEIGVGTFAFGSVVYGVIGSDLKVTITDVETTGAAILGTVECPLVTDADGNKFVYVRLSKSGVGYALAST